MEIWKDIEGYDMYQVSNQGRVRSRQKGDWRLLKQGHGDGRYSQVVLVKDRKRSTKRVHQLVAEAFLPNPDHKPHIDHKDGDILNNYADNLQWATPRENINNPNTKPHLQGDRKKQRKQREEKKMICRLERMRTNDRCIIGDRYMVFFDRYNDYYLLSYPTRTIDINGKTYVVERADTLPDQYYTRDYLNEDGTIDYAGLWSDMEREMTAGVGTDMEDDGFLVVNEDGDDEIVWRDDE